ncbi:MAG: NAD-dependent epimerase/dehydratase family protein [Caldilineaceae bacterium]
MTMFITGGTSSIGRILIQEISARGMPMRVLVRPQSNRSSLQLPGVTFVDGDVTDAGAVRKGMEGCQFVTHLAAIVAHNLPETEWWRVNCDGTRNVLQAAQDLRVESMVQVSSLSVFGPTRPDEIADERRPINTGSYVNLYQKTKHAADLIAVELAAQGLPVKIVYPGFGYGCSQATSHPSLHEQTLLRMAAGKPVAIMGNGNNRLCLAYYNDTVAAILLAHEKGKTGEGYILGNENLTFRQIWAAIAEILDKKPPHRHIPLAVLKFIASGSRLLTGKSLFPPDFFDMIGSDWCFSNGKAKAQLGWQPHSFLDSIRATWLDYQKQGWSP